MTYLPLFRIECMVCGTEPVVGVRQPGTDSVHSTDLCGTHFFQDRSMRDYDRWNEPQEATE